MSGFTSETADAARRKGLEVRRPGSALKQAVQIQNLCFQAVITMKTKVQAAAKKGLSREDAQALVNMVRAWEACTERVRIARGRPLPGSLRPTPPPVPRLMKKQEVVEQANGIGPGGFGEFDQNLSGNCQETDQANGKPNDSGVVGES